MSEKPREPGVWHKATGMAARQHAGQLRKDGRTPYIAHPFRVTMIVRALFGCDDEIALAAALLHDTIEDTGADFEDVAACIGTEGARIVAALSKDMRLPEDEREAAYDEDIRRACWKTKLIKLADAYDNLTDTADRADTHDPPKVIRIARRAIACARAGEPGDGLAYLNRAIASLEALIARSGGR